MFWKKLFVNKTAKRKHRQSMKTRVVVIRAQCASESSAECEAWNLWNAKCEISHEISRGLPNFNFFEIFYFPQKNSLKLF